MQSPSQIRYELGGQGAPASVNRQLDDPSFRQGVEKGMKYLDE